MTALANTPPTDHELANEEATCLGYPHVAAAENRDMRVWRESPNFRAWLADMVPAAAAYYSLATGIEP